MSIRVRLRQRHQVAWVPAGSSFPRYWNNMVHALKLRHSLAHQSFRQGLSRLHSQLWPFSALKIAFWCCWYALIFKSYTHWVLQFCLLNRSRWTLFGWGAFYRQIWLWNIFLYHRVFGIVLIQQIASCPYWASQLSCSISRYRLKTGANSCHFRLFIIMILIMNLTPLFFLLLLKLLKLVI